MTLSGLREDWIDISVTLYHNMTHWPGDPPVKVERVQDLDKGDSHTLSRLTLGSHSGTHVDAPAHFLKDGASISDMSVSQLIGPARVIEIVNPEEVTVEELSGYGLQQQERVLFKTANSALWTRSEFSENFVHLTARTAEYLAGLPLAVVGVDYLSVGGFHRDGSQVHRILLESGIWIIEGLDLSAVSSGRYDLICLPLKIRSGDGAPARAVVRPLGGS
ncbi:Arylformamidase [Dehalogenimonas lykanthroporepellens BL-DC-9]|jgi:arylformamidase|nr:Arylformamidase [Dehalogenimonas lykanthroporepellens BL-DC-9]